MNPGLVSLGRDTAVLTAAGGVVRIRPTAWQWGCDFSGTTHVAVSGSLPSEVTGIHEVASREGSAFVYRIADSRLQSGRPVGCSVEFFTKAAEAS